MRNSSRYEGETLRIRCEITGFPLPRYVWLKDGRTISDLPQSESSRFSAKTTPWGSRCVSIPLWDVRWRDIEFDLGRTKGVVVRIGVRVRGVWGLHDLARNGFFCFRSPVGNPYRILYLSINWEVFNTENFIHHKIWQKLNNNNNNNKENRPTCNLKGKIKLLSCYSAVHQVPFVQHKRTTCISYYKI